MGSLVMFLWFWGNVFRTTTTSDDRSPVSVQYFDYPEEISCSPAGLRVRIRNDSFQGMSIRLSIVDDSGVPRDLRSLHSNCSFATIPEANGSLLFSTPYDGCYVHVVNNTVSMELRIDGVDESERIIVIERIPVECSLPSKLIPVTDKTAICAVSAKDRVLCGSIFLGEKACNAKGCCYDPENKGAPCFYGKTTYIDCTSKGLFTIVVPRVATVPSLDLGSITLANNTSFGCSPKIRTTEFVVFSFPLNACGSVKTVTGQNITYQVDIVAKRNIQKGTRGSITRDSTFRLHVKCYLNRSKSIPLSLRVNTPSPPSPVIHGGGLYLAMRIAKDQSYGTWFADGDYPLRRYLREPLYIEVRLLHRLDGNIELALNDCWATQTQDPHLGKQWSILVNGCPYYGDNYLTQLHKVNTTPTMVFPKHHKWFEVKTFQFWDRRTRAILSGKVYFHCSASVCPLSEECAATCNAGKREVRNSNVHMSMEALDQGLVTLEKPIIFFPEETGVVDSSQANENVADNILLSAAVASLALALITGLVLCWNCKQMHKS
ncbi:zona pellucida sperm-binding protein 4-like [Narcine bancroftii]|uniref:zona pellucida sperm-binding protein 4-like n=1 Tax=Narcine bancroftii TaxID=1343680 RepID=UPI0038313995